jgi:hypothetical protein
VRRARRSTIPTWRFAEELFRVALRDPVRISRGRSLIGRGPVATVGGRLAHGNGGFNIPWSWHLIPESAEISTNATIEVCQACPSFVEADLAYWIDHLGSYCPVGFEVLAQER